MKDVTLAKAFQFSRDLLIRNGQSVRFFSLEDTTLDKLSSLDDSRFSFLKSSENSDGSFSFSSGSGLSFDLALNANDQGLAALVVQAQDLAPVLNTAPFMNGETLNSTLVLAREATLDAVTGLYKVVDPTGLVMAADGSLIAPGAAGYTEAALRADNLYGGDEFKFSLANGKTKESSLAMENLGGYLAPYAKVQTNTFFAFAEANSDGISHFRVLGNNLFGLEDQVGGGDRDFDDHILGFNFTSITAATTNTETPYLITRFTTRRQRPRNTQRPGQRRGFFMPALRSMQPAQQPHPQAHLPPVGVGLDKLWVPQAAHEPGLPAAASQIPPPTV